MHGSPSQSCSTDHGIYSCSRISDYVVYKITTSPPTKNGHPLPALYLSIDFNNYNGSPPSIKSTSKSGLANFSEQYFRAHRFSKEFRESDTIPKSSIITLNPIQIDATTRSPHRLTHLETLTNIQATKRKAHLKPIAEFKKIAAMYMGMRPETMMLKRQGQRPMKNFLTLEDYEVGNGASLDLEVDTGE